MVAPGIDARGASDDAAADRIVPYRHIEGAQSKTTPAGPLAIKMLRSLQVRAGGRQRLALMADLGQSDDDVAEFTLLALFDLSGKPKLLDVVEVGTDRLTGLADRPVRPLGRGADLLVVESEHFGGGTGYLGTELILARNGRFSLIAAIATFNTSGCGY
jgi:hypothetical protein